MTIIEHIDIEKNKETFLHACRNGIGRDGIENLLAWLEKSDFFTCPASTRFHGAFAGGLCQHSLNVYNEFLRLWRAYDDSDLHLNTETAQETATIITLFHDLCKVNCYATEKRNRKNGDGQWETYDAYIWKPRVNYGGHGGKSVFIVQQFMKLTVEEAVAINCHMGAFTDDWKDVGAAFEQYPLAWLLSVADQSASFLMEKE